MRRGRFGEFGLTRVGNEKIADMLSEVADLLDREDSNPFRVRSYRRAAERIRSMERPVAEILEDQGVTGIKEMPGVGIGANRRRTSLIVGGVLLGVGTWIGFWLMGFWGEMLWFRALEQSGRFWREVFWKLGVAVGGLVAAGVATFLLTWPLRGRPVIRAISVGMAAFVGLSWGKGNWPTVAMYVHGVSTDLAEPILGRPIDFYLFVLPLYDALHSLGLLIAIIALFASAVGIFMRIEDGEFTLVNTESGPPQDPARYRSLFLSAAVVLAVWSWGQYLNRFHLLYSEWGVATGAGWTDVHVRLPGYWITCAAYAVLAGVLLIGPVRRKLLEGPVRRAFQKAELPIAFTQMGVIGAAVVGALLVRLVVLGLVPGLLQWFRVEPNEITFEKPYIAHNIEFTRKAFRLHRAEEREFPASERFPRSLVKANRQMFDNIRLWDYRALAQVYSQFQEIRLYYEFTDVDIDRYRIDGRYRQVMISARELELSNLPSASQTFVNRHFKYTHGNGVTLTTVSDFTAEGLPDLLVKDIPPVSRFESLEVAQPRIYYGELTGDYAVVNSKEREFDYPRGQENVYVHYDGTGGVRISNLWRRILFGWKHGQTRFLLSGYPTAQSRIMFRREIRQRVQALAPFLRFDKDPYVVLVDGRLQWILDAYTTSTRFPYSQPFDAGGMAGYGGADEERRLTSEVDYLTGVNYIRNSVKAVIDAYEGTVRLYVMEPEDPIIQTWQRIFPDLFISRDEMPPELFDHVRYPADLLLVQGLVYAKYHMTDPEVFYNLEDLWVRATEKYYQSVQAVQPYYILWKPPGSEELEYVLMLPFTPKNKQVLIGWIAGMCDGDNYGRFLAYRFPKERRLLGPQQVETKIDQDPHLSGQLTLWDQRGSKVIRGNVLAIPVAETLMYVEPIYIQAETAAYPELRLVVIMHNDRISYAETFDKALQGTFQEGTTRPATLPGAPTRSIAGTTQELIRRAGQAFDDYVRLTGEKKFGEASRALSELQGALEQLREQSSRKRSAGSTP